MKPLAYTPHLQEYIIEKLPPGLSDAVLAHRPQVFISSSAPTELLEHLGVDTDLAGLHATRQEVAHAIHHVLPTGTIYIDDQGPMFQDSIPYPAEQSFLKQIDLPTVDLPQVIGACEMWRSYGFTRPIGQQPTLIYVGVFGNCGFLLFEFDASNSEPPLADYYASIGLPTHLSPNG